jgi:asparagine synthase (glutamine-hydrolysing)
MCGIAGMISPKGIEPQHLERMSAKLSHRGPDGCGFMVYADQHGVKVGHNQRVTGSRAERYTVGFVHRRLSVIDLSEASLQPMVDESGTYCLTYNGEIYNYLELRAELEGLEYTFKTTGDTEVLLRAYEAWGTGCLSRLNGMWAFVLLDTRRNRVIISRDRFGIKPLFYTLQNNTLYFASEIKGLLAARDVSCAPNERTISRFLLTGLTDHTQESFFRNIFRFPAAHWAAVSLTTPVLEIKPEPYCRSHPQDLGAPNERVWSTFALCFWTPSASMRGAMCQWGLA